MKQTITQSMFRDAFHAARPNNFSYEALGLLFDYFEECDPEAELDVIAICCEYSEDTVAEIARHYSIDLNDADPEAGDYEEQCRQIVLYYLNEHTSVIGETDTGIIFALF